MLFALVLTLAPSSTLVIEPDEPRAEIFVDGQLCAESPCRKIVAPGSHEVFVQRAGRENRRLTVSVAADETKTVPVTLVAASTSDDTRLALARQGRAAAWSMLASGAALLVTGFVLRFGVADPLMAQVTRDSAAYNGSTSQTPQAAAQINARIDQVGVLDRAALAAWIIGSAALLASLGLFIFAPSPNARTHAEVAISVTPTPTGGFGALTLRY
jgi:hypothetical protein